MSEIDIVAFRLEGRLFGIEARQVQDVFHPRGLTRVPLAGPEIIGVLNLRGRIVTALCVRQRLGLKPRPEAAPEPKAVGIDLQGDAYGLVVDTVEGVIKLDADETLPPPDKLSPRWAGIVCGVFQLETELLILLDPQAIIRAESVAA